MPLIPRADLTVADRQRQDKSAWKQKQTELYHSILKNGLLHPLAVERLPDGKYLLTGGETRLGAIDRIAEEGKSFFCGESLVDPGFIPVTDFAERTPLNRMEAEFDENFVRSDPSWQDKNRALTEMHKLRIAENPQQTIIETAREIVEKGAIVGESTTVRQIREDISRAMIIEPHLNDPLVQKARNAREAHQIILKKEENSAQAELIRRRRVVAERTADVRITCGDMRSELASLTPNTFDLICSDPPYGINAHNFHKGDRSSSSTSNSHGGAAATNLHHYRDTPDEARSLLKIILSEGFRVTKAKANLILFTDISHFDWLQDQSKAMGWVPWRRPIIWQKSESEGLISGWGRYGFIMTYDVIFFATKGQRGLNNPILDILTYKRVPRNQRLYSAEKPVDLMRCLVECCTHPGDYVLDPCAGSGTALVACRDSKRKALGFEIDSSVVDLAETRLVKTESEFESQMETLNAEADNN